MNKTLSARTIGTGAAALAMSFIARQAAAGDTDDTLKSAFTGEATILVGDTGSRHHFEKIDSLTDAVPVLLAERDNADPRVHSGLTFDESTKMRTIDMVRRSEGKSVSPKFIGTPNIVGAPTYKSSVHGYKGGVNRPMWRASKQGREHHLSFGIKTGISIAQNKGRWVTNVHFMGVAVPLPAHANLTICKDRAERKLQDMLSQWADLMDGKHIAQMSAAAAQEEAIKIKL